MSIIIDPIGRRLLAHRFTKQELNFLSVQERFFSASETVVSLDDGMRVARIGEELLREAWTAAGQKRPRV